MTLRIPALNDAKVYPFGWFRAMLETGLQPGAIEPNAHKATAAAAGGQRLDIAAGTALVKGTSGTAVTGLTQGLYLAVNDASIANAVTLAASNASLPRLDRVFLRVNDTASLGSAGDSLEYVVVAGTATSGATLDNASGAGAPTLANALLVADVLVPAGSTVIAAGNVRDRRPWARGANFRLASLGGDVGIPQAGTGLFGNRFEVTSGNALEVTINGNVYTPSALTIHFSPMVDNTILLGTPNAATINSAGAFEGAMNAKASIAPTAGSRVLGWFAYASGNGGIVRANSSAYLIFAVREILGGTSSVNG